MTLFKRSGPWTAEPIVPPYPGASPFGGMSTGIDGAMRNDAVWSCVRLLADSVSMMPLGAYTIRQGVRVPAPTPELIKSPAVGVTTAEWVYMLMVSMLLRGNAFAQEILWDGMGKPKQVVPLNPDQVLPVERKGEPIKWRVGGVELGSDEMTHMRAYPMPGSVLGLSPIRYAASRVLTSMEAAAAFGTNFLSGGGHPSSIISIDKPMTPEQAKKAKESFISAVQNREPAMLSGGVKWESVQISPEESQFLETQKMGVAQIARIFGVPVEMIGGTSGNSMNYANVTQRSLDFLVYSVQPWLTRLETAISAMLPGDLHVRFDTSVLVRMDELTKANVDKARLSMGVKTINEVRVPLDLAPVPWGDEPYLPSLNSSSAMVTVQDELVDDKPPAPKVVKP
ncbi:phage portal protein [bacterium]|nr:phage portal protein [bacterium]